MIHHVIHHNDNDGRAAAAVVQYYLGKKTSVVFHCVTYGYSVPAGINYTTDKVYIVDFSFPVKVMEDLFCKLGQRLWWVDHHQGALDMEAQSEVIAGIAGLRALGDADGRPLAGCELAWRVLCPGEGQPVVLTWVGDYDTWRVMQGERAPEVWAFNMALYNTKVSPDRRYDWWHMMFTTHVGDQGQRHIEEDLLPNGRVLVEFERKKNRSLLYNQGFKATLITKERNYQVLAVNSNGESLMFLDYKNLHKHDALMKFFWVGLSHLSVGLYSDNSYFDCNKICHELGHAGPMPSGGGHPSAGGFQTKWDHFTTLLKHPISLKTLGKKIKDSR